MTLKEIRTKFVQLSGRFDLVVDTVDYADNGADFFIQEASRFLDKRCPTTNIEDSSFFAVAEGEYSVELSNVRAIREVWYYTSEGRYQLREVDKRKLMTLFSGILTGSNVGIPAIYAPIRGRLRVGSVPSDFLHGLQLASTDMNGVIFSPASPAGTLEVIGKHYSTALSADVDTNYWSIHHAMVLVWASLYQLEVSYRNTEGAKDWLTSITLALTDIDMDFVEEASENVNQLGAREND